MLEELLTKQPMELRRSYADNLTEALNNRYWYHKSTNQYYNGTFRTNADKIAKIMNKINQNVSDSQYNNKKYSYIDFYCTGNEDVINVINDMKSNGFTLL